MSGALRRPWNLDKEAFEQLLDCIDPDRNVAAERFASLHHKLVLFFTYNRCSHPENCADQTLDRVAKRIADGQTLSDINAFAYGVAKLVLLEAHKQQRREVELRLPAQPASPNEEDERDLTCLESCLANLPAQNRELIRRYYSGTVATERRRLAEELGISMDALRTRALRIRRELENCVTRCRKGDERLS